MLVPLYGFLRGDVLVLLVLVQEHDTIADVARRLQEAASVRVNPSSKVTVHHDGRALDPSLGVSAAGLRAFDRVDVIPEHE